MQIKWELHLQTDIISIFANAPVQVVNNALESCPFTSIWLIVNHRLQHLLVATRNKTQGSEDLQHCHLGLDVLRAETLRDGVNTGAMRQDMSPPRGVVHDRLDTPEGRRVDARLGRLPVHPRQQVQETGEAAGLQEPRHKTVRLRPQSNLKTVKTSASLSNLLVSIWKLQLQ